MRSRHVVTGLLLLGLAYAAWMLAFREQPIPGATSGEKIEHANGPLPGPAAASSELARKEVDEPDSPALPWSKDVLALDARDEFYNPIRTVPFLHHMLNNSESNSRCIKGEVAYYGIQLEEIVNGLPSDQLKAEAHQRNAELREAIQDYVQAAKEFEIEHWRQRFLDFHAAVESGHYVVVEYESSSSDEARAKQNEAALESLHLGRMNHDFLYITSTSRKKNDQRGPANAIIYVTRSTHPKSLELLDELRRLRTVARDVVWSRLGVAAQPTVPVDGK